MPGCHVSPHRLLIPGCCNDGTVGGGGDGVGRFHAGDVMMSRRKQSNPKPIKVDGDEDTSENVAVDQNGHSDVTDHDTQQASGAASPDEERGESEVSEPRSDTESGWSPGGDDAVMRKPLGGHTMDEGNCREAEEVGERTSENHQDESRERSPLAEGYPVKLLESKRESNCPEKYSNIIKVTDDDKILIKTELPESPQPLAVNGHESHDAGHSESRDTGHSGSTTTSSGSVSGSRFNKRVRRSRSRSRSKSGGVSASPEATPNSSQTREEAERALVNQLQLPSDVLYLKQQDMNIHGTPSVGWVVCCAIPLPQGSSLGPFQGQLVPPEAVKVGDLIVQFTNKKGQQALMNVAGQSGGWLALLRSASNEGDKNTHVYWEGGRIWCEIISDIDIGTELRSTFSFQSEEEGEDVDVDDDSAGSANVKDEANTTEDSGSSYTGLQQHSQQQATAPGHAALIYGCPFCGVRFSSPRTLQGHLSFYCSKKTSDLTVNPTAKAGVDKKSNPNKSGSEGAVVKSELDFISETSVNEPKPTTITDQETLKDTAQKRPEKTEQTFKCRHCSYKADKLSSLNRHMRMHNNDKCKQMSAVLNKENKEVVLKHDRTLRVMKSPVLETFCKECRIQFSSLHTYKCHKEHYCAQRRKKSLANPFAAMFHSPFSFTDAAKVGIPSALQMAALNQGGLILPREANIPGGTAVILTAPMLTSNGMANITLPAMIVQPMAPGTEGLAPMRSPRVASTPEPQDTHPSASHVSPRPQLVHFLSPPPAMLKNDYTESLEDRRKDFITADQSDDDIPLDLSVTKVKTELDSDKRKTEPISFLQPDKDGALDARSSKRSSIQSSSSPDSKYKEDSSTIHVRKHSQSSLKDDVLDNKRETTPQHFLRSEHISPATSQILPHPSLLVSAAGFLPLPGLASLAISPQAKHSSPVPSTSSTSISKCSDCNIVFYKYDNYLIHKKHYCSGKRRSSLLQSNPSDTSSADLTNQKELLQAKQSSPGISSSAEPSTSQPAAKVPEIPSELSPSKHSSDIKYKFYCVPCRIKFSNASILEAHKEYYCPAGKDSEHSVILQSSSNDSTSVTSPKDEQLASPDPLREEFSCTRCNSVFSSARLLRLHVCDGGFPCPHCDHVSITDNRLAEHMKIHAPTKAYRCTICGYRGNTARGMRMHGKTHIDEGLDFTDENMLEYHEPALVPVIHNPHPNNTTDSELLRLKNEPYKRRRSRKAYEKFDYPRPKVDIPQTCVLCGQNFPNKDFLTSHFKVHEIAASQYMAGLMKCLHCDYVGKDADDVRSHFEVKHLSGGRGKRRRLSSQSAEEDSTNEGKALQEKERNSPHRHMVISDPNCSDEDTSSDNYDSKAVAGQMPVSIARVKSEPMEEDVSNDQVNNEEADVSVDVDMECTNMSDESSSTRVKEEQADHELADDYDAREPGEVVSGIRIKREISVERETYSSHGTSSGADSDLESRTRNFIIEKNDRLTVSPSSESGLNLGGKTQPQENDVTFRDRKTKSQSQSPPLAKVKTEHGSPSLLTMAPNFLVNFSPNATPGASASSSQPKSSPSHFSPFEPSPSTTSSAPPPPFHPHPLSFSYSTPHMAFPYVFLQPHLATTSPIPLSMKPAVKEERASGLRYCQNCDISFSKHSTYLAHKKYYCTARPRGESQPSAKA